MEKEAGRIPVVRIYNIIHYVFINPKMCNTRYLKTGLHTVFLWFV